MTRGAWLTKLMSNTSNELVAAQIPALPLTDISDRTHGDKVLAPLTSSET